MRRALLAPAGLVLLVLAGCTSNFIVEGGNAGGAPTPTATDTATPEPTETTPAEPEIQYECDNLLLNAPGNYYLGDCGTITLEGSGIDLVASSIAVLIVRGENADVVVDEIGRLELSGQGNTFEVRSITKVEIQGNGNVVTVEDAIGTLRIEGNENVVTADEIGSALVNGLLNEVEPAP